MECILCDFDGVLCTLDRSKAADLLSGYAPHLRLPASDILDQYFFSNPHFQVIDNGSITYQAMLESIMPDCWMGGLSRWLGAWEEIWACYTTNTELLGWLARQSERGIAVRIITDNHREFRKWFNSRPEFLPFHSPDALICSGEIGYCKPSKQIFDRALAGLASTMPEACFIDDNLRNIREAQKLGMTAVHHVETAATIEAVSCWEEQCYG